MATWGLKISSKPKEKQKAMWEPLKLRVRKHEAPETAQTKKAQGF